jgi:photosystem II stability/assembly factor-like uncharacterized protein
MNYSTKFFTLIAIIVITEFGIYSQSGWVQQNSGVTTSFNDITAVDPNIAYAFNPFLKTTNGGTNWVAISAPGAFTSISFPDAFTGYACNGTVYKTTNGGSSWSDLAQILFRMISFPNASTGYGERDVELIAGFNYIYVKKTTDGGFTWTNALTYMSTNTAVSWYYLDHIQAPSPQVVYQTLWHEDQWNPPPVQESSLLRTTNGGANWTTIRYSNLFSGDTLKYTTFHFPSNDTGYVVGNVHPPSNKSYMLRYAGGVWTILRRFDSEIKKVYFPTNTTGYILTGSYDIYKTTNSGNNWFQVNPPGTTQLNGMSFLNALTGYAAGANGLILKTITGGENTVNYSISGNVKYQDNNNPVTSGYVKALKYDSLMFNIITVDSAQIQPNGTYTFSNIPPSTIDIMAYENDEEELSFVPTYYVSTINWQNATHVNVDSNTSNINISVKRTVNSGNNFHIAGHIYTNNQDVYNSLKDAVIYSRVAGVFKGYSISLSDGYYCIDSLPSGVHEIIAERMGYDEGTYIVSITNSSLDNVNFYLDNSLVPVKHISSIVPDNMSLGQNYPNPFNPITNIKFQVDKTNFANLTVYDISGRVVADLVNGLLKPGVYEVEWDAGKYASGIYFYKLETENFIDSKKMILIK